MKDLEHFLLTKNTKPTAMRLLVMSCLLQQTKAISLNDLEEALKPVDRITVYRTLKTFEKNGLIHGIDDGTGAVKYALCEADCDGNSHHDIHVHFYCHHCKQTQCLPKTQIPQIALPLNFVSEDINLTVKGICNLCSTI